MSLNTTELRRNYQRRLAVYEAWDELHADLPDTHEGLDPSHPYNVELVLRDVRDRGYRVSGGEVQSWLGDPDEFSPHCDRVALRRALSFDWDVINRLTPQERAVFTALLWELPEGVRLGSEGSGRREAYRRGSAVEQKRVRHALGRIRGVDGGE